MQSSIVQRSVSPPVTRETRVRFPVGEINFLRSCLQSAKHKFCRVRNMDFVSLESVYSSARSKGVHHCFRPSFGTKFLCLLRPHYFSAPWKPSSVCGASTNVSLRSSWLAMPPCTNSTPALAAQLPSRTGSCSTVTSSLYTSSSSKIRHDFTFVHS